MLTDAQAVLDYWIGPPDLTPDALKPYHDRWYEYSPATDDEIRQRFGATLAAAEAGKLDEWQDSAAGALALVVLFDQFTRNLFRGTADAWRNDARALEIALRELDNGRDAQLPVPGRIMLLHPLLHAEDRDAHGRLIREFERLLAKVPVGWHDTLEGHLTFARNHGALIARFGRFPHRNAMLGRPSTAEEEAFLAKDHRSYGQATRNAEGDES